MSGIRGRSNGLILTEEDGLNKEVKRTGVDKDREVGTDPDDKKRLELVR